VRHPRRRDAKLGAELEGEAGPPGVVPAACVHEEDLGQPGERTHRRLEERPLPWGQEPRSVEALLVSYELLLVLRPALRHLPSSPTTGKTSPTATRAKNGIGQCRNWNSR
jgi:hypothetical protein